MAAAFGRQSPDLPIAPARPKERDARHGFSHSVPRPGLLLPFVAIGPKSTPARLARERRRPTSQSSDACPIPRCSSFLPVRRSSAPLPMSGPQTRPLPPSSLLSSPPPPAFGPAPPPGRDRQACAAAQLGGERSLHPPDARHMPTPHVGPSALTRRPTPSPSHPTCPVPHRPRQAPPRARQRGTCAAPTDLRGAQTQAQLGAGAGEIPPRASQAPLASSPPRTLPVRIRASVRTRLRTYARERTREREPAMSRRMRLRRDCTRRPHPPRPPRRGPEASPRARAADVDATSHDDVRERAAERIRGTATVRDDDHDDYGYCPRARIHSMRHKIQYRARAGRP